MVISRGYLNVFGDNHPRDRKENYMNPLAQDEMSQTSRKSTQPTAEGVPLQTLFEEQRAYFATDVTRTYEWRIDQLDRLIRMQQARSFLCSQLGNPREVLDSEPRHASVRQSNGFRSQAAHGFEAMPAIRSPEGFLQCD
jgi:hypothetical protein